MQRVWLKSIKIEDFRNIENSYISFSEDINIIYGENGQGKTNLLEAIWLLSGGKSFKYSKDSNLININKDIANIKGVFNNRYDDEDTVEIIISKTEEKKGRFAKVNSSSLQRASLIAGRFYFVVFAPFHLGIVTGASSLRRKIIDAALCQIYPNFLKDLRMFNKFIIQKNALLKTMYNDKSDEKMNLLYSYNEFIAQYGFNIYIKRKEYLDFLLTKAKEYYKEISNEKEEISFKYQNFANTKEEMLFKLNDGIDRDIKAGFSSFGVQKEDIKILINEISAKEFASQGQQRSIVLALKLSESDAFLHFCKTQPIILLDDVLSELDFQRQEYLLNHIKEKQVFISSCDEERIKLAKSKKYEVVSGKIKECI